MQKGGDLVHAMRIPAVFVVLIAVLAALFAFYPQLDIAISSVFYDAEAGKFAFAGHALVDVINLGFNALSVLFIMGFVAFLAFSWLTDKARSTRFRRLGIYFVALFLLGPMAIVNFGFKENWGRARPVDTEVFGGSLPFTPYYQPTDACQSDCSFMSGHTSRGFYFISLYFVAVGAGVVGAKRRLILAGTITYGSMAALTRVMEGKHFASDVLTSAILMSYLAWVLYRYMQPMRQPAE